jgi:hypothetical protein
MKLHKSSCSYAPRLCNRFAAKLLLLLLHMWYYNLFYNTDRFKPFGNGVSLITISLLHCRFLKKMSHSGFIMRSAILTVNVQNYYAAVNQGVAVSDTDIGLLKAILLLVQDVFKVSSSS